MSRAAINQSAEQSSFGRCAMSQATGHQVSLGDAVKVFEAMPTEWQLASLHPHMVKIDAERDASFRPVYWYFSAGDRCLLHCFQLSDNPGLGIKDIQSAYGYGGPLSNCDEPEFLSEADRAFTRWARNNSVLAEFLRFHPLIPHSRWYAGQVFDNRETVYVDLAEDLFKQYQTRRRTDVRRFLENNLKVRRVSAETMLSVFPGMYESNMDEIGATKDYYFPDSYLSALLHFNGSESWLAYADDEALAGAVILASRQARVAEYCLAAKARGSERYKVMAGLLHCAGEYYKSISYRYLYLGGGRSTDPNDSLLFFKKGFSSSGSRYQTGARVYEPDRYAELKATLPDKVASGRVLFYKS